MNNQSSNIVNKLLAKEEFLQLDKILNRFNIFNATSMGHWEVKHTKFLSFLLDPNESHALGDFFIRNFVTRLADRLDNFPNLLDLDFSFAETNSEVFINSKDVEQRGSVDIVIKIPLRTAKESFITIAIENKIKSKQAKGQLAKYSGGLKNNNPINQTIYKLFLVYNDEDPGEKSWIKITYGNDVLPTVQATIDILGDRISAYLKACLESYLHLLEDKEEGASEEDDLANLLLQDIKIHEYFNKSNKSNLFKELGDISIKYKKVIEFLRKYDTDSRSNVLKFWKGFKENYDYVINESDNVTNPLILRFEKSNRSYLRFSLLTANNRTMLSELDLEAYKWLDSKCPLAFEVRFYDQKTNFDKVKITLMLGPVERERLELLKKLYPSVNGNKVFDEKNESPRFNVLINVKRQKLIHKNVEWEKVDDPVNWLISNVLKFDDSKNDEPSVQDWLIEVAKKYNNALDELFNESVKI